MKKLNDMKKKCCDILNDPSFSKMTYMYITDMKDLKLIRYTFPESNQRFESIKALSLIPSKLDQMLKFINNAFLKKFVLYQLTQNYHAIPATYDITMGFSVTST